MASAVASSSTLWAQASKEWVIPAKPKPGRKPKKDPPPPPPDECIEPDSKGRRVQNRAAQRAFRERKQSQLADLQARVQLYEQGEMERNVALQNIAKRLKEENEHLRRENLALHEELRKLKSGKAPDPDRKRWREDSNGSSVSGENTTRKRIRTDGLPSLSTSAPTSAISMIHSPPSLVSSPESVDSTSSSTQNDTYSPLLFADRSPNPSVYSHNTQPPAMASLFSGFPGKVPGCSSETRGQPSFDQAFEMVDCGFCTDDTPCVCRELALQAAARIAISGDVPGSGPSIPNNVGSASPMEPLSSPDVKVEAHGSISIDSSPHLPPATVPGSDNTGTSILDNLPAFIPPVPLPRRRQPGQSSNSSIFPIFTTQPASSHPSRSAKSPADCSGDPSNCLACADDPFGKAFCVALGDSVNERPKCPKNDSLNSGTTCRACSGSGDCSSPSGATTSSFGSPQGRQGSSEKVPCNTAWAQLKTHPNIAFADLTLLAEVVARRSKCTGPRVLLSPDPEIDARQQADGRPNSNSGSDDAPILLTDPHARYHEHSHGHRNSGSRSHASSRNDLQCGRQRVVEVEADGIRDALALLDGQYRS